MVRPNRLINARLVVSYEVISVEAEQNAYAVPSINASQYMRTKLQAADAGEI